MVDDLIRGVFADIRQEYEILVLSISHQDVGLSERLADMVAELVKKIDIFLTVNSFRRRKRE